MVSKAREDLPEPETPVMTTSFSRGISRSMDFRLCSRAPRMRMVSLDTSGTPLACRPLVDRDRVLYPSKAHPQGGRIAPSKMLPEGESSRHLGCYPPGPNQMDEGGLPREP